SSEAAPNDVDLMVSRERIEPSTGPPTLFWVWLDRHGAGSRTILGQRLDRVSGREISDHLYAPDAGDRVHELGGSCQVDAWWLPMHKPTWTVRVSPATVRRGPGVPTGFACSPWGQARRRMSNPRWFGAETTRRLQRDSMR